MIRVSAAEARPFFDHPTQRRGGMIDPADLHDNGLEYWVLGDVCGLVHQAHWPGVWMVHYGVKPSAWGEAAEIGRAMLEAFWAERQPERIIGWTKESNRLAVALARRAGFVIDGKMNLPSGTVLMQGWEA